MQSFQIWYTCQVPATLSAATLIVAPQTSEATPCTCVWHHWLTQRWHALLSTCLHASWLACWLACSLGWLACLELFAVFVGKSYKHTCRILQNRWVNSRNTQQQIRKRKQRAHTCSINSCRIIHSSARQAAEWQTIASSCLRMSKAWARLAISSLWHTAGVHRNMFMVVPPKWPGPCKRQDIYVIQLAWTACCAPYLGNLQVQEGAEKSRYDMIWYDMIWYDMIWYDMIWYDGMIQLLWNLSMQAVSWLMDGKFRLKD